jgi:Rieske Fe-S protein
MQRREFTKACISCLTGSAVLSLLSACQSTHYTTGLLKDDGITVLKSEFTYLKKDQPVQRDYIIVRNDAMEFPIYVYRFGDEDFAAMLMKCTHQGNELQASGDHLHCSAHGSEFNNRGVVAQGPAEDNLRTFKVTSNDTTIFIDLRA